MLNDIPSLAKRLEEAYATHNINKSFTVALSGIDAAGKGFITKQLQTYLEEKGYRVANINIDPWQQPLGIRLNKENPAQNIYENIFRWDDFFEQLLFPLKENKSIYLVTNGICSHADVYYPLIYDFKNIDIILIDGILLLKKNYFLYYDLRIWINCSFETGIQRAISRNVEQLDEQALINDYNTFYYAAQRYHFEKDKPIEMADIIYNNDPERDST